MCRLLAWLGEPVLLDDLLWAPEHGLVRQAFAPRHQKPGRINADGWGVGWWDHSVRPEPARYRTATPAWADQRFAEIAPLVHAGAVVAAVRNASKGAPVEETGASPFASGPWLFTHNGYVDGYRDGLGEHLRREVSPGRGAHILGAADSEVLFALLLDRLDAGEPPERALVELAKDLHRRSPEGRYNLLLGNGTDVWAVRWGNSLFVHPAWTPVPGGATGTVVASEPSDDDPGWHEVPERSLVRTSTAGPGLAITPIDDRS